MYTFNNFRQNLLRTDRFSNPEQFLVCMFLVACFVFTAFYHGANSSEQATFINMPALDKEMTPYERYFKETNLTNISTDLVHIRLQNGVDTFAVWPRTIPLVITGSKIKVSSFMQVDEAFYVKL